MRIKKRLFVGLISGSLMLLFLVSGVLWYVDASWHSLLYPQLVKIVSLLVIFCFCVFALGIIGIVLTIFWGRPIPLLQRFIILPIHLLFPLSVWLGRFFNIEKEAVERSFIEVNNQLVRTRLDHSKLERILILAPHCLQQTKCLYKVTFELDNCQRCGACAVDGLLTIAKRYSVRVAMVTGGTLARQVVKNIRPHLIIAVACERDLTSGIQDCYPIPVIGILNTRPEGPCINTCVDLNLIENELKGIFKGEISVNDQIQNRIST